MSNRIYESLAITRAQALRLVAGTTIHAGGHAWTVELQEVGTDEEWRSYVTVIAMRPAFVTFPGTDYVVENVRWARFHQAWWFDRSW